MLDIAESIAEQKYLPCAVALDANESRFVDGRQGLRPGKLAACRYFFRNELPTVHARFDLVRALDRACLDLDAEQFTGI